MRYKLPPVGYFCAAVTASPKGQFHLEGFYRVLMKLDLGEESNYIMNGNMDMWQRR